MFGRTAAIVYEVVPISGPLAARMRAGKCFERSRGSRLSHSVGVKRFVCTIASLLCLMMTSCVRQEEGEVGTFQSHGRTMTKIQADNARFEFPMAAVQPESEYWMKAGEPAQMKWDTFELHWEQIGQVCVFNDNTSTDTCSICDYCAVADAIPAGVPCFGKILTFPDYDALVVKSLYSPTNPPKLVKHMGGVRWHEGCPGGSFAFDAEISGTYDFRLVGKKQLLESVATRKIRILGAGEANSQFAAFALTREEFDSTEYWTWEVGGVTNWLENFSPSLRVTSVGILKGECLPDPNTGQCIVSDEMPGLTASRVLFLPDFQGTVSGHGLEGANKCYSHTSEIEDRAFINLDQCRNTYDISPNLATAARLVTPTYDDAFRTKKLKWLVQFNTTEGGDANPITPCNRTTASGCDAPDDMDEMIIVFRIEAT